MTTADASGRDVLFVVMDTVRKDHLSVYGYDRPTTPGLEAFAENAAVYEQAVAPAPWTLPVHASLFTGRYPSDHGANQENPYLEGTATLAESLSATHESACYSSNAWITPYTHLTDGFDDQDNFFQVMPGEFLSGPLAKAWKTMNDNERLRKAADWLVSVGNKFHEHFASGEGSDSKTPQVIDRTKEFVDGVDEDENFFAFVNLMDAHLPYHPPEEYKEEFAPGVDSTEVCQNSKEYNCGARDIDDDEWSDIRGLYDAEIRHIDAELRRLFDWLQAEGRWEDTLVVVCADHGELHGEHGLYGHEFCIYDPLVNVPLMVKHPDVDPGRYDEQVELLDLYHTVLDHAGVDPSAPDAVALDDRRSLLSDDYRGFDDGEFAFVEYSRPVVELKQLEEKASAAGITLDEDSRYYSRMRAGRRPDAKYIRNERIDDEAYRIDEDPGETENVAGDDDAVAEVRAALERFEDGVSSPWEGDAAGTDEAVLDDMDEDAKERLQDLGYID
ncbi:sulfatase-like hydrolase/transferase [Halostella litorea]|uniref:sulfatase-like hydrolase/transferase n=1 Tax=Halostella litorea TaxID=2528831 RepID=UPI0010925A0E|nr:sulfatase-like hydrolase/transferase [Halostella litorea]